MKQLKNNSKIKSYQSNQITRFKRFPTLNKNSPEVDVAPALGKVTGARNLG